MIRDEFNSILIKLSGEKFIKAHDTTPDGTLCSESMLNRWYNQAITTTYRML